MVLPQYYKFSEQAMFNRDTIGGIDVYVLTAYFVDPSTICTTGRDASSLQKEGTGVGLWLQNGTDPIKNSFQSPMQESDVGSTKWVKGACFPSMGKRTGAVGCIHRSHCLPQVFTTGTTIDSIPTASCSSPLSSCTTRVN